MFLNMEAVYLFRITVADSNYSLCSFSCLRGTELLLVQGRLSCCRLLPFNTQGPLKRFVNYFSFLFLISLIFPMNMFLKCHLKQVRISANNLLNTWRRPADTNLNFKRVCLPRIPPPPHNRMHLIKQQLKSTYKL